jgi:putative tryptophan/tyrosine transport system substrate-binding protein
VAPDFKETLQVARIAALANAGNPAVAIGRKEIDTAARKLGMELQLLEVRTSEEIGPAFDAASRQNADALIVQLDGLMQVNRKLFVELAVKHRLPAVYGAREFVDAGGLMFYGVSYANLFRRAATYVDRILKGTRPADLPVEQPTKFELVINLKTARALGLTMRPSSCIGSGPFHRTVG